MSAKAVREYYGKKLLAKYVKECSNGVHLMDNRAALVTAETDYDVSALLGKNVLSFPRLLR